MNVAATEKKRWSAKLALAAEPKWSHYQQAIFDWVESGTGNLRVGAVAGSGKTTVLKAIVTRLPVDSKAHILAFNKHIVDSLKSGTHSNGCPNIPSRVGVSTAHSMGNSLLARRYPDLAVESNKYSQIARAAIVAAFGKQSTKVGKALQKEQIKFLGAMIRGVQSTLCSPTEARLVQMIEYFNIESPQSGRDKIIGMVKGCIDAGMHMAEGDQVIDFGDMLYLPHVWGLQPTGKDWVLVDEVQDANNAQLSLYAKMAANGRALFVGDADQAIQGFAFASPAMWDKIRDQFITADLPLSVCYRCPTSHLDLARYFVPHIESAPGASEGEIATVHPSEVINLVQSGDLILCRFTAPLVSLCIKLLVKGIAAKVRGKDIGKQLVAVADIGEDLWEDFRSSFNQIIDEKIIDAESTNDEQLMDRHSDHRDCIVGIYDAFGKDCRSLSEFLIGIEELFSDDSSPITLSTIHRAKGDESNRVFILASNLLPYSRGDMVEWQEKQEENIAYVALTRAKKTMFFVPMGKDDCHMAFNGPTTDELMDFNYGGFSVQSMPINIQMPDVAPYPIGSMFTWAGMSGYKITSANIEDGRWIYQAEYTGNQYYHWASKSYPHRMISNVKVPLI